MSQNLEILFYQKPIMYSLVVDEGEKFVLFGLCSHVEVLSLLSIGNRNYCLNSIETWIDLDSLRQ